MELYIDTYELNIIDDMFIEICKKLDIPTILNCDYYILIYNNSDVIKNLR